MAEKDPGGPSLELPSLGFGRRRREQREAAATEAPEAPESSAQPTFEPEPTPQPGPEPTPAPRREPEPATRAPGRGAPLFVDETPRASRPHDEPAPDGEPGRRRSLSKLGAVPAVLVTGLLVGVITVGLVWASLRLCELVRGTSSCGNPGFLLLVAVLVAAGLVGGSLLRAFGVAEGGSTSFLAMGLVAVVLMVVLGDHLFAWWMILAVPAVAMVSYVLAQRLTTAVVEPTGSEMHR